MKELNPLAIQKLKITGGTGSHTVSAKLPELVTRVGKCLIKMLRNQYEALNSRVADLTPAEALSRLREQIILYLKGAYPFNRPFREGRDYPGAWWNALNAVHDAQPLAVCTLFPF